MTLNFGKGLPRRRVSIFLLAAAFLSHSLYPIEENSISYNGDEGSEGILIKEVSSSKKSIILDRGFIEGVEVGQIAAFYYKSNKNINHPKLSYVAEGEVIKSHNNYSFWYLRKVRNYRLIEAGRTLIALRKAKDKRRPFINRHTQKVLTEEQRIGDLRAIENKGVPNDLVFEEEQYLRSGKLVSTRVKKKQDSETEKLTRWKKSRLKEYDEQFEQERPIFLVEPEEALGNIDSIKEKREREIWRNSTANAIAKINDLPKGLKGLYAKSLRGNAAQRSSENNIILSGALKKIEREGVNFSRNMSDEQLRKFFIKSGLEEEIVRQRDALSKRAGSEISLAYHSGLSDHSTSEDPNFQNKDYALSIGYEFHLGLISENLAKFTVEGILERAISFYDLGGVNARISEGSFRIYMHWFFWNEPSRIKKLMPFIGIGFRRGNGTAYNPNFLSEDQEYRYQMVSLPTYRVGVKYRFKAGDTKMEKVQFGIGTNIHIQYEQVHISNADIAEEGIFTELNLNQLKLGLGVNVYF